MATEVRWRRGTQAEHDEFVGAESEVTVNTTDRSLHVHDGVTPGGRKLIPVAEGEDVDALRGAAGKSVGTQADHEEPEGKALLVRLDYLEAALGIDTAGPAGANVLAAVGRGAIVESDSNSNGEFIKYADGTLICTNTQTGVPSASGVTQTSDWVFPAPFSTSPLRYVQFQARVSEIDASVNHAIMQRINNQDSRTTKATYFWRISNGSLNVRRALFAIGRWK